jgi:hypothetical protein
MRFFAATLFLCAFCTVSLSQIHVMVEPADTAKIVKPVVLDSTATAEAKTLYLIVRSADRTMRDLQRNLLSDFSDANREDKVRQKINGAWIEEQIALWDFQIKRAAETKDTPLLRALQIAFIELARTKSSFQQPAKQEMMKLDKLLGE